MLSETMAHTDGQTLRILINRYVRRIRPNSTAELFYRGRQFSDRKLRVFIVHLSCFLDVQQSFLVVGWLVGWSLTSLGNFL